MFKIEKIVIDGNEISINGIMHKPDNLNRNFIAFFLNQNAVSSIDRNITFFLKAIEKNVDIQSLKFENDQISNSIKDSFLLDDILKISKLENGLYCFDEFKNKILNDELDKEFINYMSVDIFENIVSKLGQVYSLSYPTSISSSSLVNHFNYRESINKYFENGYRCVDIEILQRELNEKTEFNDIISTLSMLERKDIATIINKIKNKVKVFLNANVTYLEDRNCISIKIKKIKNSEKSPSMLYHGSSVIEEIVLLFILIEISVSKFNQYINLNFLMIQFPNNPNSNKMLLGTRLGNWMMIQNSIVNNFLISEIDIKNIEFNFSIYLSNNFATKLIKDSEQKVNKLYVSKNIIDENKNELENLSFFIKKNESVVIIDENTNDLKIGSIYSNSIIIINEEMKNSNFDSDLFSKINIDFLHSFNDIEFLLAKKNLDENEGLLYLQKQIHLIDALNNKIKENKKFKKDIELLNLELQKQKEQNIKNIDKLKKLSNPFANISNLNYKSKKKKNK